MSRQRDNKGRFVKGNEIGAENRKPFTKDNASEMGQRSGEAKRRNKLLKEVLRDALLEETTKGSGITKQEAIVQNVLKTAFERGLPKDLKIIAEVLGEMEINVNVNQSEKPKIVFDDGE